MNEVWVLIGQDMPQTQIVQDYCWGDNATNQLCATKTLFGWCMAGPTNKREDGSKLVALSIWASESYGFGNAGASANSVEDNRVLEILEGSTRLRNGRY